MMDIGSKLSGLGAADTLHAADGSAMTLTSYVGKGPLVVYFYPKADTPGCTTEAQDFTALKPEFDASGATIIGISRDKPAALAKFAAKYGLGVTLASDEGGTVSDAFGTWVEKSMYGKSYMGLERATYLFDALGTCTHVWRKVKVKGHAAEVLAAVRGAG